MRFLSITGVDSNTAYDLSAHTHDMYSAWDATECYGTMHTEFCSSRDIGHDEPIRDPQQRQCCEILVRKKGCHMRGLMQQSKGLC